MIKQDNVFIPWSVAKTLFILFSYKQTFLEAYDKVNVYFLVAKTTHETPFNLPNVAVYLAMKKKVNLILVLPVKLLTKKLVFFTSYDCNWHPYKVDFMAILVSVQ